MSDKEWDDEHIYIHCCKCGQYLLTLKDYKEEKIDAAIGSIYCHKCAKKQLVNLGTKEDPEWFTKKEIRQLERSSEWYEKNKDKPVTETNEEFWEKYKYKKYRVSYDKVWEGIDKGHIKEQIKNHIHIFGIDSLVKDLRISLEK